MQRGRSHWGSIIFNFLIKPDQFVNLGDAYCCFFFLMRHIVPSLLDAFVCGVGIGLLCCYLFVLTVLLQTVHITVFFLQSADEDTHPSN